MKILYVSSDNNKTSGAFLCLVEMIKELRKNYSIEPLVVVPKKGDGIGLLEVNHIPYIYIRSFSWVTFEGFSPKAICKSLFKTLTLVYNIIAIDRIVDIIKNENIDIVHINTIFSYVGAIAALKTNVKLVWHIREMLYKGFHSKILTGRRGYNLISKANKIIAVSDLIRESYKKNIVNESFITIYDGVAVKDIINRQPILSSNRVNIACIGGLLENKNQKELIYACAKLIDNNIHNFVVHLIGRGPLDSYYKHLINSLNLDDYVKLLGACDNVQQQLNSYDVVCSAAISEAFGRTLVEGMFHGCLVVAANWPSSAASEIIENKKNGLLYQGGDINALADILAKICKKNGKSDLQNIADRGKKFSLANFTTASNAEKLWNIYNRL